jgi:hypothetical protein
VCPELRGYGESSAPADLPEHSQASKRAMAKDPDWTAPTTSPKKPHRNSTRRYWVFFGHNMR